MNKFSRIAATINSQANPFQLRSCLFHGTPVSERRRRTNWDSASSFRNSGKKFNRYQRRIKKQSLLRNVSEFAEDLFRSWQSDRDDYDQPTGRGNSWFRPNFRDDRSKRGNSTYRTSRAFGRDYEFCDDDDDDVEFEFETIFRSAFGGSRYFYWSFTTDDEPRYRYSSSYSSNYRTSSGWKHQYDEEYDSSSDYERPTNGMSSDRLALGLSPSGPLNLEDVKNAYRACALKWHPDRHQGSSKVVAEEKFKVCSAAYQSLCNKLALH